MMATLPTADLREHSLADTIPTMRLAEWKAFLADVRERGILEPLHVAPDGVTVLDGRHRLRAAQELGLVTVPVIRADLGQDTEVSYALKAAVLRRHLTDDQRAFLAAKLAAEIGAMRRAAAGKKAAEARWSGCVGETPSPAHKERSRDLAAAAFGVSAWKVRNAAKLITEAPDLAENVRTGKNRLQWCMGVLKLRSPLAERGVYPAGDAPKDRDHVVLPLEYMWGTKRGLAQGDVSRFKKKLKELRKQVHDMVADLPSVPETPVAIEAVMAALTQLEGIAKPLMALADKQSSEVGLAGENPEMRELLLHTNRWQKNHGGWCAELGCWAPITRDPKWAWASSGGRKGWHSWGLEALGPPPPDWEPVYCDLCQLAFAEGKEANT